MQAINDSYLQRNCDADLRNPPMGRSQMRSLAPVPTGAECLLWCGVFVSEKRRRYASDVVFAHTVDSPRTDAAAGRGAYVAHDVQRLTRARARETSFR